MVARRQPYLATPGEGSYDCATLSYSQTHAVEARRSIVDSDLGAVHHSHAFNTYEDLEAYGIDKRLQGMARAPNTTDGRQSYVQGD